MPTPIPALALPTARSSVARGARWRRFGCGKGGGRATTRAAPGLHPFRNFAETVAGKNRYEAGKEWHMGAVVIAEDDPDIRAMITQKLSRAGHQVTAAEDGAA